MSFLFDKLFQKQNPELAGQMAKRGLVFDKRKHRWVRGVQPDANVTGGEFSEIPGMEGPFRYKTGNTYYYSPKEGKYYDRGQDVFMPRGFDPHTGQYSQTVEDKPKEKSKYPVADTLLQQLGGNKFIAMTGAKNFMSINEGKGGLQFSLPSKMTYSGINRVKIVLDESDTYNVEFWKVTSGKNPRQRLISSDSMIYGDELGEVMNQNTGLATKL